MLRYITEPMKQIKMKIPDLEIRNKCSSQYE